MGLVKSKVLIIMVGIMSLFTLSSIASAANPMTEENAAATLSKIGLLKGDSSGNLMLDQNLKREEVVVIISRLLGVESQAKEYAVDKLAFTDVPKGDYKHYIAWAFENKIVLGNTPEKYLILKLKFSVLLPCKYN